MGANLELPLLFTQPPSKRNPCLCVIGICVFELRRGNRHYFQAHVIFWQLCGSVATEHAINNTEWISITKPRQKYDSILTNFHSLN
ncbi:uncharacterized protein LOC111136264 isoform X3 [Crassostrea virginica]